MPAPAPSLPPDQQCTVSGGLASCVPAAVPRSRACRPTRTLCPSGLRGWTQVPLARAAWAQIPQVSLPLRDCATRGWCHHCVDGRELSNPPCCPLPQRRRRTQGHDNCQCSPGAGYHQRVILQAWSTTQMQCQPACGAIWPYWPSVGRCLWGHMHHCGILQLAIDATTTFTSRTLCPSGLRGWTQVPLARAAWAQIPQVSLPPN